MLHYCKGDVYIKSVDIIYNPVGVTDNNNGFYSRLKKMYPDAYTLYKDFVHTTSKRECMGEIQIVPIAEKRVMLNGFCKTTSGYINKLALCKTLVELCNLAYEYKLSVGIEYALGKKDEVERKLIKTIIHEVFHDVEIEVYLFNRDW